MALNFRGVLFAGAVTPLNDDYEVDEDALARYLDWLAKQKPDAIAINVDLSEGPHLTREEKRRVLTVARETLAGRVSFIAGVTAGFTAAAVGEAEDAEAHGAQALQVFPLAAFHGDPLPAQVVVGHFRALAASVSIPLIPFLMAPRFGGVKFSRETLLRLSEIESVMAIKESSWDLTTFRETLSIFAEARRRPAVLSGNDRFLAESLAAGADGALAGFATIGTAEQLAMVAAAQAHDLQKLFSLGQRLQPLADALFRDPIRDVRARVKTVLHALGVIPNAVVRPPLLPISASERRSIEAALVSADLECARTSLPA